MYVGWHMRRDENREKDILFEGSGEVKNEMPSASLAGFPLV